MATRRNRKRAAQKKSRWRFPSLQVNWHRLLTAAVGLLMVLTVYISTIWLMNRPIQAVVINGSFERVSAVQLEEALADQVQTGFLSADLAEIRARAAAIPWVARATVQRRWPGEIVLTVFEEKPAACWGESGLLNTQGELFVSDALHRPAELPRLSGPEGTQGRVAELYFQIQERLEQRGLSAVKLDLDARGGWSFQLNNGVLVRLGDDALDLRLERFFSALDGVIATRAEQVNYVDMRYTNGFSIGWKDNNAATAAVGGGANNDV